MKTLSTLILGASISAAALFTAAAPTAMAQSTSTPSGATQSPATPGAAAPRTINVIDSLTADQMIQALSMMKLTAAKTETTAGWGVVVSPNAETGYPQTYISGAICDGETPACSLIRFSVRIESEQEPGTLLSAMNSYHGNVPLGRAFYSAEQGASFFEYPVMLGGGVAETYVMGAINTWPQLWGEFYGDGQPASAPDASGE